MPDISDGTPEVLWTAPVPGSALECLGAGVIFLAANVLLGTLAALTVPTPTSHFVGLYVFSD